MTPALISTFTRGEYSLVHKDMELEQYLQWVRDGKWEDLVHEVRGGKREKREVPSVTVSGTFQGRRRADNLAQHSGYLAIDLDAKDNDDLLAARPALQADPHCYACHVSIGGFGLVWYVRIDPARHLDAFQAIERHLANTYGVVVDPSGKDVTRLRFVSHDPGLYHNTKAKKWTRYLTKAQKEPQQQPRVAVYHDEDIRYIIEQITSRGVNIAEEYHDWLAVSFAMASEFGESGRDYFHAVSAQSGKYDAARCDKQYDIALRRDHTSGISIGTFFYFCKRAGIETTTPETREAISIYRQRVRMEPGRPRKEAAAATAEYMERISGVARERVEPILEKLDGVGDADLKQSPVDDKVLEIEGFIQMQGLSFNEITRYYEKEDGSVLDDREYGSLYRRAMHAIGFNVSQSKLYALMDSDLIRAYNPFTEFFDKYKHLRPTGRVTELVTCFDYEKPEQLIQGDPDYLEFFLTRWLLGIISAMNGTHSVLVLVLTGGQGVGKTKFFRNLLPEELEKYYADNKMSKESEIAPIMTKKILVCDDEFSGKNKREADEFKELVSKKTFSVRKPYGKVLEDLKRYAVLCGTSNDDRVLFDMTGNRRVIPVKVRGIDHKRMEAIDKVELFMELYWMWREIGDGWMLEQNEIEFLNRCTDGHQSESFEMDMLVEFFEPSSETSPGTVRKTTTEVKRYLEMVTKDRINLYKLGAAITACGFERKTTRSGGATVKKWFMRELKPEVYERYASARISTQPVEQNGDDLPF